MTLVLVSTAPSPDWLKAEAGYLGQNEVKRAWTAMQLTASRTYTGVRPSRIMRTRFPSRWTRHLRAIREAARFDRYGAHSDPGKKERYQAEALIWKRVPVAALHGVCCYTEAAAEELRAEVLRRGLSLKVAAQSNWYF